MGQIVFNGQKPKYCNLSAITTGNHSTDVPKAGEIWLIDSTDSSKPDGKGKYDYYIIGDNSQTASQLAVNKIRIDDNDVITIDDTPTSGSNHAVSSGGVYQALQDASIGGTVDDVLDSSSNNPVKNHVIKAAIDTKDNKVVIINHGTSDTTFALTPNVLHVWGEVTSLTLTLASGEAGVANEYMFRFYSGTTPTTLNLPLTVQWVQPLNCQQDKYYEVSIINNLAAYITSGMVAAESSGGTPEYATKDWVTNKINVELDEGFYYE